MQKGLMLRMCLNHLKAATIIACLLLLVKPQYGQADTFGALTGQVVDKQTGEPLIGVSVLIANTNRGASSDLNGTYFVDNIPQGVHSVVFQLLGYAKVRVDSVTIPFNRIARLDMELIPQDYRVDDIVVTATIVKTTEASLLKQRQKSSAISDAISAEMISRSGSGTAAEAMMMVTGASVIEGKYVYIRGVGDRYSNTTLNGAELPSADPDKKAFHFDLIPGGLLDNIVTVKSFTPDRPGDFSGGLVDISTRSYPESLIFIVSSSASHLRGTTGNRNFITYAGGGSDWLGRDDGTRGLPEELADPNVVIPDIGTAYRDTASAYELQRLSRAFNNIMAPKTGLPTINRNFAFSFGNKSKLFGCPVGYYAGLSYDREFNYYDNGKVERWTLATGSSRTDSLANFYRLSDKQGSDQVLWGGLSAVSLKPNPHHELSVNYLYTQSGESTARYLNGYLPENLADAIFETRVLKYSERNVKSLQFQGHHNFKFLRGIQLEWLFSSVKNSQDEPDLRFFSDHYYVENFGTYSDTTYSIVSYGGYKLPQRLYRDMDETGRSFEFKFSVPFKQWSGLVGNLKFGYLTGDKKRTHRERVFEYHNRNYLYVYDNNPEEYFSNEYVGIVDSTGGRYTFANYIVDASELRSNYNGKQIIRSSFLMVESSLTRRLRIVGGYRNENVKMDVVTLDQSLLPGRLRNNDWLGSASFIYQINDKTNIRAAYGRTLARPTFRELAPYPSYEFAADYYFIGNAKLKRTLIDNYDLRYEWFFGPGEIIAASYFKKYLKNPIERAILSQNGEIQFQNVDKGHLTGVEIEARMKLDRLSNLTRDFQFGGNVSFVKSRVEIPDDEMTGILAGDSAASNHRPLWGQASYDLSLDLAYDNPKRGLVAAINYNVNGKRLSDVSLGATPDIYEQPFPIMNLKVDKKLPYGLNLKLGFKNVLDSKFRKTYSFKGNEYTHVEYKKGRAFSLGLGIHF